MATNMRVPLLLCILRIAFGQAHTAELGWIQLDGTVLDALSDSPIVAATVKPGYFGPFTTDAAGHFSAEFQERSDFSITIAKAGYVTAVTKCRSPSRGQTRK